MSKVCYDIILEETLFKNNKITYYESDLPHGKELAKRACEDWNKQERLMTKLVNECCYNRVESCIAKPVEVEKDGAVLSCMRISFVGKPHAWLSDKFRTALVEFMEGQITDGWGEGYFNGETIMLSDGSEVMIW